MKNVHFLTRSLFWGTLLLIVACSDAGQDELFVDPLSDVEVQLDVLLDDLDAVIDDVVLNDELDHQMAAKGGGTSSSTATCVIRKVQVDGERKKVTLDFGDGCQGKKDNVFVGKLHIHYLKPDGAFVKEVSFENFSVNGNAIEGSIRIVMDRVNAKGYPMWIYGFNLTVTLETGVVIRKEGRKKRELVQGANTKKRDDDVMEITGAWKSVSREGVEKSMVIRTPLRKVYSCRYIVSGIVDYANNGETATVDYGDGSCDNKAIYTSPSGETKDIILKKR